MTLKVLDIFSGIGGFSLGLERTGMRTVAFCEIEPYCRAVLRKHWPEVPIYEDIRSLTASALRRDGIVVDVICGGFPCQPFSTASRGRRTATDLWPEQRRIVECLKCSWVIAENVAETPIACAAKDLRVLGYRTHQQRISASDCGADHQRDRWWLVAHPNLESEFHRILNAEVAKLPELCRGLWGASNYARAVRVPSRLPTGMDRRRIEALGNAVIPQIPEVIGRAILESIA